MNLKAYKDRAPTASAHDRNTVALYDTVGALHKKYSQPTQSVWRF